MSDIPTDGRWNTWLRHNQVHIIGPDAVPTDGGNNYHAHPAPDAVTGAVWYLLEFYVVDLQMSPNITQAAARIT